MVMTTALVQIGPSLSDSLIKTIANVRVKQQTIA